VGFVDDNGVIVVEARPGLCFGKEHAVGHDFDVGLARRPVPEADFVSNRPAERLAQLFGDSVGDGDGRDAARLRAGDPAGDASSGLEAHLGYLRAFTAAGFAGDDDHGFAFYGADDFAPQGGDGKLPGKAERGPFPLPPDAFAARSLQPGFKFGEVPRQAGRLAHPGLFLENDFEPAAGRGPVLEHRAGKEAADIPQMRGRLVRQAAGVHVKILSNSKPEYMARRQAARLDNKANDIVRVIDI